MLTKSVLKFKIENINQCLLKFNHEKRRNSLNYK